MFLVPTFGEENWYYAIIFAQNGVRAFLGLAFLIVIFEPRLDYYLRRRATAPRSACAVIISPKDATIALKSNKESD